MDPVVIAQKVIQGVYPGVTTVELDELAAQTAASFATQHPDCSILAARISVSNLHKMTKKSFSDTISDLHFFLHPKTKEPAALISDEVYEVIMKNKEVLDAALIHDRDFEFDYFGFKTLEKSYLLKLDGVIVERPQHLLMRVSVGIHLDDIEHVLETYSLLSQKYFTHATPTLFNAGTPNPQMSSCFLLAMKDDSIDGIYDTLKHCAVISKYAGGIGMALSNVRASESYIRGTNGSSNGIVPMLRVFNNTARYVDQGGGKRKGSIAAYLEPWHADVFAFLDLRKNHGDENQRARDLFYALWIPDLFMERVQQNGEWTLMCPNECPGLDDCHGDEFKALYTKYERENKGRKVIKAQQLWFAILDSQVETGTPYMLFKDHCNNKSNQKNLGTIKSSNLCTEIVEYTSPDEIAVCNLASISLSKLTTPATDYDGTDGSFDFDKLKAISEVATRNLNRVIDRNFYPREECKRYVCTTHWKEDCKMISKHCSVSHYFSIFRSNFRHRPIGIGVQGLADVFMMLKIPFDSEKAKKLNKDIFETIYFGACTASCELAKDEGAYETYEGSPASQGILQFDMWNVTPSDRWDWAGLKANIAENGMRNSLLVAPMPTASTAQILGNNESTEPYTSNMYNRRVLAGEFTVVNKHLLRELTSRGLWTPSVRNRIIADGGSVQNVPEIPKQMRDVYKTVWEIAQKVVLDMAADRGAYICQSQSMNVHIADPNTSKLTSMHFYAWKKGLKTGMYYLRTRPKADAIKFTVDQEQLARDRKAPQDKAPVEEDDEICYSCGA